MKKTVNRVIEPDPPSDLISALVKVFLSQHGTAVLLNYRRLRRAGYRGDPVRASMYLDSALTAGFPDPLNRGVWRVERVERNGNRKKYYLILEGGGGSG
jgi:hypothetical protein